MKKVYEAPEVEIELYALDASIALNCGTVVDNGPAVSGHTQCDKWDDSGEDLGNGDWGTMSLSLDDNTTLKNFYADGSCDCYVTSSGGSYWTS